ncbi:MAG: hypothetical protein AAGF91_15735 [Actinomycetota bacterium]
MARVPIDETSGRSDPVRSIVARPLTSVLCLAAAMCATFAWTGFVYLQTWADPGTPGRVVNAVLDDPDARAEVIEPFEDRLRSMVAVDGLTPDQVSTAIDAVLSDSGVRDRLAAAFAPDDGGLSPSAAIEVLRSAVSGIEPAVADRIDELGPALELDLPALSVGDGWRGFAERWVLRIGLVAAGLFLLSFAVGDRRRTLRNLGLWSFGTGLSWWLGPLLIGAAARRWASAVDAVAGVVVDTYVRPIRPWAILLSVSGTVLLVVALTVGATSWWRRARSESDTSSAHTGSPAPPQHAAAHHPTHPPMPAHQPAPAGSPAPFSPATVHAPPSEVLGDAAFAPTGRLAQTPPPPGTPHGTPASGAATPAGASHDPRREPTADDVDVWGLYASPTAASNWTDETTDPAPSDGSPATHWSQTSDWSRPSGDDGSVGDPDHTIR